MAESDKPVSFIVRGSFLRRPASDAPTPASEETAAKPRSLPSPRYSIPPLRSYRARQASDPDHVNADPDEFRIYPDRTFYKHCGRWRPFGIHEEGIREHVPRKTMEMPKPVPGLTKRSRGHRAPTADNNTDPRRKHVCPVKTCRKIFVKRFHLCRHISTIHKHPVEGEILDCYRKHCPYFVGEVRKDNFRRHQGKHGLYQEIFACSADDDYKGIRLINPLVVDPLCSTVKPYATISIPPLALSVWRAEEKRRRAGERVPHTLMDPTDRFFLENPELGDMYLRTDPVDPRVEWRMPPAGPEFTYINSWCLYGKFKLQVPPPGECSGAEPVASKGPLRPPAPVTPHPSRPSW
ncbi:hypothetical protein C8Q77DRAFT_118715 [Trametes polyzona]|nr:hypothetical protein C8Q77DRAFT_118715 [Trametes polyzona]